VWNTPLVLLKKKAAERLCKKRGWVYKLVDITPNSSILKKKYLDGEIKFVEKYRERFEQYANIKEESGGNIGGGPRRERHIRSHIGAEDCGAR
jgi:hypothetical protein